MADHTVTMEATLLALLNEKKYFSLRDILTTMNPCLLYTSQAAALLGNRDRQPPDAVGVQIFLKENRLSTAPQGLCLSGKQLLLSLHQPVFHLRQRILSPLHRRGRLQRLGREHIGNFSILRQHFLRICLLYTSTKRALHSAKAWSRRWRKMWT